MANLIAGEKKTPKPHSLHILAIVLLCQKFCVLSWCVPSDDTFYRTETLSVLLDYRSEDNKEGTFEVGFPQNWALSSNFEYD